MGWSPIEAASNRLGDSSHRLGGGVLDPARFVLEQSRQSFSMGGSGGGGWVPAMQMHYNESRAYPGAAVEEKSGMLKTCDSWSVNPRVWEVTGSNV